MSAVVRHFTWLAVALLSVAVAVSAQAADRGALVQMAEYVGADYVNAVSDGQVVSADEYQEMSEFTERLAEGIAALPDADGKATLQQQAQQLRQAVSDKASDAQIKTLAQAVHRSLVQIYGIPVIPTSAPDMAQAAQLYQSHCALCHGDTGHGDGPAAKGLEPPPINFHDQTRYDNRSLLGLYTTITGGVDGTSMAAFQSQLDNAQRWALAFYVGQMAVPGELGQQGEQALKDDHSLRMAMDLDTVIAKSPADVRDQRGDKGYAALGYLRQHPDTLFSRNHYIELSHDKLEEASSAYAAGDRKAARNAALAAYLDGYEMIEQQISAVDDGLMRRTERSFMAVRSAIEQQQPASTVTDLVRQAQAGLKQAEDALNGGALSPAATFSASFFILFREGLEALLVVAALLTFTRKANAKRASRFIHIGWVVALLAGIITWFLATELIRFSGASREVTEGVGGVLAALILFYVGFWMHSNSNSQKWLGYIKSKVDNALDGGTIWALAVVAFISVYRELFETILFYQALWSQVTADTQIWLLYGLLAAIAALALVCLLIFRLGMRLPLGVFFKATSIVLLVLSVVLLGKGIAALQEAGWLNASYLDLPTFSWLGFFPTWQGALAQLVAVVLAVVIWWRSGARRQTDKG